MDYPTLDRLLEDVAELVVNRNQVLPVRVGRRARDLRTKLTPKGYNRFAETAGRAFSRHKGRKHKTAGIGAGAGASQAMAAMGVVSVAATPAWIPITAGAVVAGMAFAAKQVREQQRIRKGAETRKIVSDAAASTRGAISDSTPATALVGGNKFGVSYSDSEGRLGLSGANDNPETRRKVTDAARYFLEHGGLERLTQDLIATEEAFGEFEKTHRAGGQPNCVGSIRYAESFYRFQRRLRAVVKNGGILEQLEYLYSEMARVTEASTSSAKDQVWRTASSLVATASTIQGTEYRKTLEFFGADGSAVFWGDDWLEKNRGSLRIGVSLPDPDFWKAMLDRAYAESPFVAERRVKIERFLGTIETGGATSWRTDGMLYDDTMELVAAVIAKAKKDAHSKFMGFAHRLKRGSEDVALQVTKQAISGTLKGVGGAVTGGLSAKAAEGASRDIAATAGASLVASVLVEAIAASLNDKLNKRNLLGATSTAASLNALRGLVGARIGLTYTHFTRVLERLETIQAETSGGFRLEQLYTEVRAIYLHMYSQASMLEGLSYLHWYRNLAIQRLLVWDLPTSTWYGEMRTRISAQLRGSSCADCGTCYKEVGGEPVSPLKID